MTFQYMRPSAAVSALLGLAVLASSAAGQQYKEAPQLPAAQAKALYPKAAAIFRSAGALSEEDKKTLTQFFNNYYGMMTSSSPGRLAALGKMRIDLFRQFLNSTSASPAARAHVLDSTIRVMTAIAAGNYHPAVRYNATLILGQLDKEAVRSGAGGELPVPLPAATAALLGLLERDADDLPSAVRVGALVGLERHTSLGVDPQFADRVVRAALQVADMPERPEDTSAQVFDWMRALAARVLANQSTKGIAPPVAESIAKLMADRKMNVDDRCEVAGTLRASMFAAPEGVDAEALATALASLSQDVLDAESKAAKEYTDEVLGAPGGFTPTFGGGGSRGFEGEMGMGGRGMGGFGMGGGMSMENQGPQFEKRRMLVRILAIGRASKALQAIGSDGTKKQLAELTAALATVATEASKPNVADAGVVKSVLELSEDVKRIVATMLPKAPPAAVKPPAADAAPAADPAEEAPPAAAAEPAEAAAG